MTKRQKQTSTPPDLSIYIHCPADEAIGLDPLAVGFLNGRREYPQGKPPAKFAKKLLRFCHPQLTVCAVRTIRPCSLCHETVTDIEIEGQSYILGSAEIRVIGEEDIFAAPTLIYHYVTAHNYLPPAEFIDAVLNGPQPDSAEYRALIRTLRNE